MAPSIELSKRDLIALLDLIELCLSCKDTKDFGLLIEELKSLIPFDFSICLQGKFKNNLIELPYDNLNLNYPSEWVDTYVKKDFHKVDPIFKKHFTEFNVQYWEDTYKRIQSPKEFKYLAEDFGLYNGYTYGACNLKGTKASLISLSGKHLHKEKRSEIILRRIAPHFHQVVERAIKNNKLSQLPSLTKRELETLKWLAIGKTSWEASVIMGISERTIRFYVESIMLKLDAVSRSHAIAIALDMELIELD